MKKNIFLIIALFLVAISYAQIVSTEPQNKKVVLEEFTGFDCFFCPQGHAIAQALKDANPDDVFLVNIHVGNFAVPTGSDPDFRTPFGTAIANQSNLVGYPAGTVNRHYYPGTSQGNAGSTAQSRNTWASTTNQTLTQSSYVNVGVESSIDILTNEITVNVEAYYTGNSPEATNVVNIALLQDGTTGPQTGGGSGNNYIHNHRLVHFITGQWGATINSTTAGSFYEETFTYIIPEDYNGIPTEIVDMKVVAYVTENRQEVISGDESLPAFSNLENANDISLEEVLEINPSCSTLIPEIKVRNMGQNVLNSLEIEYTLNSGSVETYNWTGELQSLRQTIISLPELDLNLLNANNTLSVSIANDDVNSNNDANTSFISAPVAIDNTIKIQVQTGSQASQNYWYMLDGNNTIFAAGSGFENNDTTIEVVEYDADCYTFEFHDTGSNGGATVVLSDGNDNELFTITGNFGEVISKEYKITSVLSADDNILANVRVYPNPTKNQFTISNAENFNLKLYTILGKEVLAKQKMTNTELINISNLSSGTYFVKIYSDNSSKTEKLVIVK